MNTASVPSAQIPRVDTHLAKFSQGCTVALAGLAFVFNQPIIVLIAAIVMTLAALFPPRVVEDDPAPHRFAQGVGAVFLIAATLVLFLTKATVVGWTLDLIVFVLAAINLTVGFCAGCFVYYHLGRWGVLPQVRYEGGFHWRGV
ncbi:MAG: DUF4395 domain-containing protein [Chloroflexi bacterium]|nr:MAG: DUF4395 domain-containing protein [Chloroflexota bacterium]